VHDGIPIFIYDDLSSWVVQFHAIGILLSILTLMPISPCSPEQP
jgi:hypothetical protein